MARAEKSSTVFPATFPGADHDHHGCVHAILADAERLCRERGARLTEGRRRVFEIVAERHGAIGAYEIMDCLADGDRRPAPVTVYRALDFLIEQGLVHRLASLNAYVACTHAPAEHGAQFLICGRCGTVGELADGKVDRAIAKAASDVDFAVAAPVVEVAGICIHCREGAVDGATG